MFFSRFLLVALAAVGVVAQPSFAEKRGMAKVHAKLASRAALASVYDTAVANLGQSQSQITDAMAGPQTEREDKLVAITASVLDTVKAYNNDFKAKFSFLDLSNIAKGGQMSDFGKKLYVILRSCKGTRNEQLYNNIGQIAAEVESMGDFMARNIPPPLDALVLPGFANYLEKVEMIQSATKVYKA